MILIVKGFVLFCKGFYMCDSSTKVKIYSVLILDLSIYERMDIDHYIDLLVKKGSPDQCTLFTDSFARFLQVVLGFIGLFVLYLKRRIEHPKRPITVST
jgi:hypothetical protein